MKKKMKCKIMKQLMHTSLYPVSSARILTRRSSGKPVTIRDLHYYKKFEGTAQPSMASRVPLETETFPEFSLSVVSYCLEKGHLCST
jgi:hypothetical protein